VYTPDPILSGYSESDRFIIAALYIIDQDFFRAHNEFTARALAETFHVSHQTIINWSREYQLEVLIQLRKVRSISQFNSNHLALARYLSFLRQGNTMDVSKFLEKDLSELPTRTKN